MNSINLVLQFTAFVACSASAIIWRLRPPLKNNCDSFTGDNVLTTSEVFNLWLWGHMCLFSPWVLAPCMVIFKTTEWTKFAPAVFSNKTHTKHTDYYNPTEQVSWTTWSGHMISAAQGHEHKAVTPSFLSLSRAPCRKSLETSSFSSNHMMTNGSNQLENKRNKKSQPEPVAHCVECRSRNRCVQRTLTPDIQVRASGKWPAPCSTRYRATSLWSAGSYNLRFYTSDASHALEKRFRFKMNQYFSVSDVVTTYISSLQVNETINHYKYAWTKTGIHCTYLP